MTGDEQAQEHPPPKPPWELPENFPKPLEGHEYGYMKGKKLHACSREELIRLCRKSGTSHPSLVWAPENDGLVPPQDVAFLIDSEKRRLKFVNRVNLILGLFMTVAMSVFLVLSWNLFKGILDDRAPDGASEEVKKQMNEIRKQLDEMDTRLTQRVLLYALLGVIITTQALYGLWRIRRRTEAVMAAAAALTRFGTWLKRHKTRFTWGLALCIVTVSICQLPADVPRSIEAAGLVKPAVMEGEYWRLLTCAMLHANGAHLFFNAFALVILGKLTEVLTHRTQVAFIFLLSALLGSIFSVALTPETTSVGASGGILGLVGFTVVLGYRQRGILPPNLFRGLVWCILLVAATGLVAYEVIDNSAHLGGFVCGVVLGTLFVRRDTPRWPVPASRFVIVAGTVSACLIPGIAALAIWKMFQ